MQVLWKIILAIDFPFIAPTPKTDLPACFQPVNIFAILREMIALDSYRLQDVYVALFGGGNYPWHTADFDVYAAEGLVRRMAAI